MKKRAAALFAASLSLLGGIGASAQTVTTVVSAPQTAPFNTAFETDIAAMFNQCETALKNGGYEVENTYFSSAFDYGSPDKLTRYTRSSEGKLQGAASALTAERANPFLGEASILKIVAKSDMTIRLTSEGDEAHNYICWAPDAYFEYIAEGKASNGNTYRISLDRRFALVKAAENSYAMDVTLKKGDALLLLIGLDFKMPKATKSVARWIHVQVSADYNAARRPNYDAMPAVVAARTEKTNLLTGKANKIITAKGYSAESVAAAKAVLADAERRFARTTSVGEVEQVYGSLLSSLAAAERLTLNANELSVAVANAVGKLDALMASVDRAEYAPVYGQIEKLYYEGLQAIYDADTPTRAEYTFCTWQDRIYTLIFACRQGGAK